MTDPMTPRKRVQLHFDVATDDQAAESAAWEEIVSGKRTRISTAPEDVNEIMERARSGVDKIVQAIEEHPGTGQTGRLVRFLAGMYNGHEFHFDLTDLRALDTDLANACIDYLNYDRLAKAEVHTHLPDGGQQMQWLIKQHRIRPRLHMSSCDQHESRLFALAERVDREAGALLKEALEDLLSQYEAKAFGGLLATQPSPDGDRPLVHAPVERVDRETSVWGIRWTLEHARVRFSAYDVSRVPSARARPWFAMSANRRIKRQESDHSFRAAINPSLGAAGKTSCFSRRAQSVRAPDPA